MLSQGRVLAKFGEVDLLKRKFEEVRNAAGKEVYEQLLGDLVNISLEYVKRKVLGASSRSQRGGEQDVLSHVQFQIVQKINTVNSPEGYIGWLRRVAINKGSTPERLNRRTSIPVEDLQIPDYRCRRSALELYEDSSGASLNKALAALSKSNPNLGEIVELTYFKGQKSTEVAEALNIPDGTVRRRLHDARRLLRELLERDSS